MPADLESIEQQPADLFAAPDRTVEVPPVTTRPQELPFHDLTWQNFEKLCFRIAGRDTRAEDWRRYGRQGQAQGGIDIYVRRIDGKYDVWQCKNYATFSGSDVEKAVTLFLNGPWKDRTLRLFLCISTALDDSRVQDQVEAQAARLLDIGASLQVLDSVRLSELLKSYPDLVDDFFGRAWLLAFVGNEAVAELTRSRHVLTGEEVIRLRHELSDFYVAYFAAIERGLVQFARSSEGVSDPPALINRFVIPDVFVREAASLAIPSDSSRHQDSSSVEGQYDLAGRSADERSSRPVAEGLERSYRRPIAEWLVGGMHAAVLGEAGSGKSTFLRFLALDLLSSKPIMRQVAATWAEHIPLIVPFARWTQMAANSAAGVPIEHVLRTWLQSFSASSELIRLVAQSFEDRRLLLLVDGVDEWVNETVARTVLDQLEVIISTRKIPAVVTGRPQGVIRLGGLGRPWRIATLASLSDPQQRKLASIWYGSIAKPGEDPAAKDRAVAWRVDRFFADLKQTGQLHVLGGTPLLLTGLISLSVRNLRLPRNRFQAYEELTKLLLDVHPNERSSAAADQVPRFRILKEQEVRHRVLGKLAFEIMKQGAEGGFPHREAERLLADFLRDENEIGLLPTDAAEGARELLAVNAETSGILVEKSPGQIGFVHAVFKEHLAAFHIAARTLEEQGELLSLYCSDPRWQNAILGTLRLLTRPSDVDALIGKIRAAPVSGSAEVVRTLLLAEVAFGESKRTARVAKDIALDVFERIETGFWMPERERLLRIVMEGAGSSLGQEVANRLRLWYPETQWSRETAFQVLGSWAYDPVLETTLWRALFDSKLDNRRGAAGALASTSGSRESVQTKLVQALRGPLEPRIAATMLEGLFQGWPGTEGIEILIDQARKSPEPILSLFGIRCRIKQGKHDADDFGAVMRLASWGSLDTYEFRSDIIHALVSGWPGDRRVYDACWEAWIGENRREGIDFDIAEAVLLGGFQNDDNVVKHLCDILTTKEHGFSGMGTPWHTLRSSFFGHPLVSAAIDERMERWLKQGTGFYREIALGCTVSGSEKAKALLIGALKGAGWMVFWPVSGLIEVWGMDDAEVSAALSDLVRCPPSEMQYFAQSLPEILGKTASCRALLLEIARQPKVERPDFLVEGMVKLGEKLWDGELVDAAVALMSHGPGLFDPTPLVIQSFGSDPRVRQRVIDLIDRCDAPLASVALSYKDDSEIRSLLLARLAPLPDNLREVVVDQASRFASDLSPFESALARYGDEREGPIRAAAAAAYYASVPDSSRYEVHISRLVEELRAVGPQMDSIRQSALSGLLALNQFSVFRDLAERDGTRPLRCPALDGSIHQNDRLVEQIAARWTTVADVLGESTLSRLSTWGKGNPTEAWDRLAPFITTSVEAFDAFLTYCRSSPDLLKANSLAALSRLQPGSALLREICERTLRHEGDHISFSPYDGLAARMTAGQILGSAFNTVAGLREFLEAVARRPCSGAITALCVGWPQSKVIDEVFEYLVKEEHTRLLPPAILNVFAVKGDSGIFVRAIRGLIAKSNGSIWDFPSFCVEAIARRLSIDDDVYTKLLQLLSSDASADELASLPRVMAMARSGDNTLQVWCEEELIKRVSDAGLCLSGLDFSSGRVRPVAQTLLDVLVHVA